MPEKLPTCFIIMPITTPKVFIEQYKGDHDHFQHVLDHLFLPAVNEAGFDPIPPKSSGSELIQAEIIKNLSEADLVLCDMSILNPNVFFEFGIRTALDKPVALTVDDRTKANVPFDTSMINFHDYDSSLEPWHIKKDIAELANHIQIAFEKSDSRNSLWKFFGVAQVGTFKPEDSTIGDKLDLLIKMLKPIKENHDREKFKGVEIPEDLLDILIEQQRLFEQFKKTDIINAASALSRKFDLK